jgi:hypothetical protein
MEDTYKLKELKRKLMMELEAYSSKDLSSAPSSTLDILHKTSGTVKNLAKIIKMCEETEEAEGGYSGRMYYAAEPMERDVEPGRDSSYRGSYDRGRRNAPRDSMGRYSGEMGYSRHGDLSEMIREAMEQAPDEQTRRELERIAARMERA